MALESQSLSDTVTKVDMTDYMRGSADLPACQALAHSMKTFGAVLVRDPRVDQTECDTFLDMMERYFSQPLEKKLVDARPHLSYQVGVTPEGIERPVDNSARAAKLEATEKPVSDTVVRVPDAKWRFFWCLGPQPSTTTFTTDVPELNKRAVVPAGFETEWRIVMDMWGGRLLAALNVTAEMLALGLGLPRDAFREKMELGPHLLAPTGADMAKYGSQVGSTMAGYHYDLNLMTIHGKSRYPGLFIWTNRGKRIPVAVPPGFLLVQAGIQLEWLTAGAIQRGMHEVVISEKTKQALESALEREAIPWRVSSTMFGHVRSDASIAPLGHFAQAEGAAEYYDITAGKMVAEILQGLELAT